jgi:2-phosphosulfolactate phosphatase
MKTTETWLHQAGFDVIFEWGASGLESLVDVADIIVIVDVLSFSTCVNVAVDAGADVFPFRWKDERSIEFAHAHKAHLASVRGSTSDFSLSPKSLTRLKSGDRIVLPSPNGSHLCTLVKERPVVVGCLRNATAIAHFLNSFAGRKLIIAAGERWPSDNALRPSFEDMMGAGAIISGLVGNKSPEAMAAEATWTGAKHDVDNLLLNCSSGRELVAKGFEDDVRIASTVDSSTGVPVLHPDGYFVGR